MDDLGPILGDKFLRYVLALAENVEELGNVDLSPQQLAVIDNLKDLTSRVQGGHPLEQAIGLANVTLLCLDDRATSLANACRLECGGQLPQVKQQGDEVLGLLQRLARDIYPGLLLPSADDDVIHRGMPLGGPLYRHPAQDPFCRAVLADASLKLLFPGADQNLDSTTIDAVLGVQSNLIFSSGRGGGLQLALLADLLFMAAYYRTLLDGELTPEAYLPCVKDVLHDVRKLASGRGCECRSSSGYLTSTSHLTQQYRSPGGRYAVPAN
jgi:hypothetical protein